MAIKNLKLNKVSLSLLFCFIGVAMAFVISYFFIVPPIWGQTGISGYCTKTLPITFNASQQRVVSCDAGFHIEGQGCVPDPVEALPPITCSPGWHVEGTLCKIDSAICGNGTLEGGEQCDSGAANGAVGFCNTSCSGCGAGYHIASNVCVKDIVCGDGLREGAEACDHGVINNGQVGYCTISCNGCSSGYMLDENYNCIVAPVTCTNSSTCPVGQGCSGGICQGCFGFVTTPSPNYKEFTVSNGLGTQLNNYQVKFTYSGAQTNFLVTDQHCAKIPYYIKGTASPYEVWVKVPQIPASGSVKIFVSNVLVGLAQSPSGNNTFELFDDFETADVNTSKWNFYTGSPNWVYPGSCSSTWVHDGGEVRIGGKTADYTDVNSGTEIICNDKRYSNIGFSSDTTFVNNFRVFSQFRIAESGIARYKVNLGLADGNLSLLYNVIPAAGSGGSKVAWWGGAPATWNEITPTSSINYPVAYFSTKQQIKVTYTNNTMKLYISNMTSPIIQSSVSGDYNNSLFFAYSPNAEAISRFTAYFDNVMVTKYVEPEPTISPASY